MLVSQIASLPKALITPRIMFSKYVFMVDVLHTWSFTYLQWNIQEVLSQEIAMKIYLVQYLSTTSPTSVEETVCFKPCFIYSYDLHSKTIIFLWLKNSRNTVFLSQKLLS